MRPTVCAFVALTLLALWGRLGTAVPLEAMRIHQLKSASTSVSSEIDALLEADSQAHADLKVWYTFNCNKKVGPVKDKSKPLEKTFGSNVPKDVIEDIKSGEEQESRLKAQEVQEDKLIDADNKAKCEEAKQVLKELTVKATEEREETEGRVRQSLDSKVAQQEQRSDKIDAEVQRVEKELDGSIAKADADRERRREEENRQEENSRDKQIERSFSPIKESIPAEKLLPSREKLEKDIKSEEEKREGNKSEPEDENPENQQSEEKEDEPKEEQEEAPQAESEPQQEESTEEESTEEPQSSTENKPVRIIPVKKADDMMADREAKALVRKHRREERKEMEKDQGFDITPIEPRKVVPAMDIANRQVVHVAASSDVVRRLERAAKELAEQYGVIPKGSANETSPPEADRPNIVTAAVVSQPIVNATLPEAEPEGEEEQDNSTSTAESSEGEDNMALPTDVFVVPSAPIAVPATVSTTESVAAPSAPTKKASEHPTDLANDAIAAAGTSSGSLNSQTLDMDFIEGGNMRFASFLELSTEVQAHVPLEAAMITFANAPSPSNSSTPPSATPAPAPASASTPSPEEDEAPLSTSHIYAHVNETHDTYANLEAQEPANNRTGDSQTVSDVARAAIRNSINNLKEKISRREKEIQQAKQKADLVKKAEAMLKARADERELDRSARNERAEPFRKILLSTEYMAPTTTETVDQMVRQAKYVVDEAKFIDGEDRKAVVLDKLRDVIFENYQEARNKEKEHAEEDLEKYETALIKAGIAKPKDPTGPAAAPMYRPLPAGVKTLHEQETLTESDRTVVTPPYALDNRQFVMTWDGRDDNEAPRGAPDALAKKIEHDLKPSFRQTHLAARKGKTHNPKQKRNH